MHLPLPLVHSHSQPLLTHLPQRRSSVTSLSPPLLTLVLSKPDSSSHRRLLCPLPPSPPSSHSQPLLTHLPLTAAPHSRPLTAGSSSHRRLSFHSRIACHLSSTLTVVVVPSRSDVRICEMLPSPVQH
ncbi:hypothetical protein Syun_004290 [Stephania yunnanensis]|uniref:Uncharacterized protein n=1 Tax=Stephania yunnanensis TaxID=152371 RepID=A0AAP0Q121_9MAGN